MRRQPEAKIKRELTEEPKTNLLKITPSYHTHTHTHPHRKNKIVTATTTETTTTRATYNDDNDNGPHCCHMSQELAGRDRDSDSKREGEGDSVKYESFSQMGEK